jgi:transcription initiation factor TFIID subunit 5
MSEDTSLIAGGFSESYVKIWSLKGEKLRSLKNNITPAKVNDCKQPLLSEAIKRIARG